MSSLDRPQAQLAESPATTILADVASGRQTVSETARAHLDTILAREPEIGAFVHLDPEAVQASAAELDGIRAAGAPGKPLLGLPVGIKDLIDTADQPTEYGSRLFAGHRPTRDAAVVRTLREAGALITGKTVTTEFALFSPGETRNPHDLERTPGGSSSGSAAAVAAGMLPVALGTQTAGSIIRPASFCGIVGFKPTFGAIDREGVFPISETLDTVGLLSRSVADTSAVFDVLRTGSSRAGARSGPGSDRGSGPAAPGKRTRIGFARPIEWEQADSWTREGLDALKLQLMDSDIEVVETTLPAEYDGLTAAQSVIMDFEVSKALGSHCEKDPALVSDKLLEVVKRGAGISAGEYAAALELAERCRAMLPEVFDSVDALVVPAVIGEAPLGREATGDPVFCRSWTLLHCPAMSLPLLQGPNGLPIGVQLIGNLHQDDRLLQTAQTLMDWSIGSGKKPAIVPSPAGR